MQADLRIATCRPLPEPDVDQEPLLQALSRRGIQARMAAWNDPEEDWESPLPTLVRSTWDYIHAVEAFSAWTERVEAHSPLWNPGPVLRANLHKRYLLELSARGLPVIPTRLIERGSDPDLPGLLSEADWTRFVIKPAVGAGSFSTQRYELEQLKVASQHVQQLSRTHDVLVQPYLESVEGHGERAIVCINSRISHAVRKSPRFIGQPEQVSPAVPIDSAETAVVERLLVELPPLLYARIDLAPGPHGHPLLMELELIEPSLFLRQHPPALERLVSGIEQRLA